MRILDKLIYTSNYNYIDVSEGHDLEIFRKMLYPEVSTAIFNLYDLPDFAKLASVLVINEYDINYD